MSILPFDVLASPAAIMSSVSESDLRQRSRFPITTSPSAAVRPDMLTYKTNVAPDLSLSTARVTSMCKSAAEELQRYAAFAHGWDGYDAEPIAPIAIELAQALVAGFERSGFAGQITDIIPGPAPDGSLDLELRTHDRSLIITIYPGEAEGSLSLRTYRSAAQSAQEKLNVDTTSLVADLRWILG